MCRQKPKSKRPKVSKAQRTFPSLYVNPSRQAASPSTTQLTGPILNDVSVKTPLLDAFVVAEGSAVLPQALGKYLNSAWVSSLFFFPFISDKSTKQEFR